MAFLLLFRQTDPVGLTGPVQAYIRNSYQVDPELYAADIVELEQLRAASVSPDIHEASLNQLLKYYGQMLLLSKKMSFEVDSIRIAWRWYTAFEKGRKKPATSIFLPLELGSVLFNIAAIYNQMGHAQMNRSNAEALKKAAFFFQSAAGAFQEIIDTFTREIQRENVVHDLSEQTLSTLVTLHLALAQECFFHKAALDQMKDATISKVAANAGELFNQAYEKAVTEPTKSLIPHEWLVTMQSRALYFNSIAQYRKSRENQASAKYGEEVGRLKAAETLLKKALEFKSSLPAIVSSEYKVFLETIQTTLKKSEKDNDVIYLESVPSINNLPQIDRVQLAQPSSFPKLEGLPIGKPLFEKLYPYAVHQQISLYNERKTQLVAAQIERLNRATDECNIALSNMGLPGSLQAYEQPIGLPPEILKKSEDVRSKGGSQSLMEQMQTLTVLSEENSNLISEIEKLLSDEAKEDEECRQAFRDKWKRTPSIELQKGLRQKVEKKKKTFTTAKSSDAIVRTKFEKALPYIAALSSTRDELEHSIPASSQISAIAKNDSSVPPLKEALNAISALKKSRAGMIANLKTFAQADNPSLAFLNSFSKGDTNHEAVIQKQLGEYSSIIASFDADIAKQPEILNKLTVTNTNFQNARKVNDGLKQRQAALQSLESAYNDFKSLLENFQEGVKFHTEFANVLTGIKNQASDLVAARSLEKKDLLKDITDTAAGNNQPPSLPPRDSGNAGPPQNYQPNSSTPYGYVPNSLYGQPQQNSGTWNPSIPISYGAPQQNVYAPPGGYPSQPQQGYPQGQYPQQPPHGYSPYGYPNQQAPPPYNPGGNNNQYRQ